MRSPPPGTSLGSHFDGIPVDDTRSTTATRRHDDFEHRLVVQEPDLQTPGARYFYDGWYLAPNDPNLGKQHGAPRGRPDVRRVDLDLPDDRRGHRERVDLDVLVNPSNVLPGQATELLDTGEGRVHLVAVTTALGGGSYHYEYALMNFTFERKVQSFSLPVGANQTVSNTGFDDGDTNAANDWTPSIAKRERHLDGTSGARSGLRDALQLPLRRQRGTRGRHGHDHAARSGSPGNNPYPDAARAWYQPVYRIIVGLPRTGNALSAEAIAEKRRFAC
jgi:hypothetical protein